MANGGVYNNRLNIFPTRATGVGQTNTICGWHLSSSFILLIHEGSHREVYHTGGLKKTAPGTKDAEPVIQIPVGLPCLKRGRLVKKGRSTRYSNPVMKFSAGGAKGCSDHRFRAPPAYTAQLLTLHQHRANNQYRTANQIQPTLMVSSSSQATLEQFPIQVLTKLNVA